MINHAFERDNLDIHLICVQSHQKFSKMEKLSCHIITKNSEQYLETILQKINSIVDEIIIVDSGSSDATESIAKMFEKVQFVYHPFASFKDQRNYAASLCKHPFVLFFDSDEVPDDQLILSIEKLKSQGFEHEAYAIARHWVVMGKKVHSIYPVISPDYPIRLINKQKVAFMDQSNLVHESPSGYESMGIIEGNLLHRTFHDQDELERKLEHYTDMAAQDIIRRKKAVTWFKIVINPVSALIKSYFFRGGYKDGKVGYILGMYAYRYTRKKYIKAGLLKLEQ